MADLYNNTNDILNPNKSQRNNALFSPWGGDPNGNNEIGRMFHDLSAGWYPIAASRVGFANQLEPGRQNFMQQAIFNASPQGQQALVDQAGQRMMASADQAAEKNAAYLRQSGAGIGAEQGAHIAGTNQALHDTNQLQLAMSSPQGQAQTQAGLANAYGQAQDIGLGPLQQMFGPMEQRHMANQSEMGSGSFMSSMMPILGQIGGMYAGGGFGGGGGGGGGSMPSWTHSTLPGYYGP